MSQITWASNRLMLLLDAYWLTLIGLLAAAVVFTWTYVKPLELEIAQLRYDLQRSPRQSLQLPSENRAINQVEDLARFDAMIPHFDQLTIQLQQIFDAINSQGLEIDKGQYKLTEKSGSSTRRFEASFPVSGSYPGLRQALAQIQQEMPNVAIADIQLQREEMTSPMVEAQLLLVLLVKGER